MSNCAHLTFVLRSLDQGTPMYVEYSRTEGQPSICVPQALFWGLFNEEQVALFIAIRSVSHPADLRQVEWWPEFNWVPVCRITVLRHDVGIKLNTKTLRLQKEPTPLIFDNREPGCELIDAAIRYHVNRKLYLFGLVKEEPVPPGKAKEVDSAAPRIDPDASDSQHGLENQE